MRGLRPGQLQDLRAARRTAQRLRTQLHHTLRGEPDLARLHQRAAELEREIRGVLARDRADRLAARDAASAVEVAA